MNHNSQISKILDLLRPSATLFLVMGLSFSSLHIARAQDQVPSQPGEVPTTTTEEIPDTTTESAPTTTTEEIPDTTTESAPTTTTDETPTTPTGGAPDAPADAAPATDAAPEPIRALW